MNTTCGICGDPTGSTAYTCTVERDETAAGLRDVVKLAPDVQVTVSRLARYGDRGGHQLVPRQPDERGERRARARLPVTAHGWPASLGTDEPVGALLATASPVNLNAAQRADRAVNTITTWARHVIAERGLRATQSRWVAGPVCEPGSGCHHGSCVLIRGRVEVNGAVLAAELLLAQVRGKLVHLEWLRFRPEAAEAFDELRAAAATIRRVVDAPPELAIVGVCDCGAYLYAHSGAVTCTCRDCGARWDVTASRLSLMEALRDRLVTAAEGATLAVLVYPGEQRAKVRDMIRTWARPDRQHLTEHPGVDGPMYPFGEIIDRLSRHVAAKKERQRATVTAN